MSTKVLQNGTIITFDDAINGVRILHNASLRIDNDRITALGPDIEIPSNAELIDATGQIITPGFINTHTHMWQTAFRSLTPDITLAQYFSWTSQNSPAIGSFHLDGAADENDIYTSCMGGYLESLNAGTTAIVEHAHCAWDLRAVKAGLQAARDSAARVWWCPTVEGREDCSKEELVGFLREVSREGKVAGKEDALVLLGYANDRLDGLEEKELEREKETVRELDMQAITVHYLGGPWPIGGSSPAAMQRKGLQDLNIPLIFSHGGYVTPEDRAALREHDWSLSITPESEMHYGHGQATSKLVQDQASLGVDTFFTFSGDMLTQARLWLQHVRATNYEDTLDKKVCPGETPMSVDDAFLILTRGGGRAVRRDDIGVLKVGAKADIVCIRGDSPNMLGWTNPVAAVVLHANVGDVEHVLVDGQFRKRDGKLILTKQDWSSFSEKFAKLAKRVQQENATPPALGEKFFGMWEFRSPEVVSTRRA